MSSPTTGQGSGFDRCTEAVCAMIDATHLIGPAARDGKHTVEQIMLQFTEMLNNGKDVSVPENGVWVSNWVRANTGGKITMGSVSWPGFSDIIACVDQGHVAMAGFDDYVSLRLASGANPYKWNDPHGLGHVLLVVGYDLEQQLVVVHDPLRANPGGQPADYSWRSFQAAKCSNLAEVYGPGLPYSINTGVPQMSLPAGWTKEADGLHVPGTTIVVPEPFASYIEAHAWDVGNVPLVAARKLPQVEPGNPALGSGTRQDFRFGALAIADNPPPANEANKSVYQVWIGQDVLALLALNAQAQSQIATVSADNAKFQQQITALKATQGLGLTPEQAASLNQIMPAIVSIAAGASSFTTAFANVPKPAVTQPLPAQPAPAAN